MFNRDALFGKKDEPQRNEPRSSVNITPGLGGAPPMRPQSPAEPSKPDLRFAEVMPKPHQQQPQQPQPQQQQVRAEEPAGSRLIVGPDIKLRGVEITDCDTLVVEGRVEASMDSRVIQIAETGVFSGTVSIDVAEIRGRFEGQLTARKHLVIYSTGRVSGQILYGKVRIEEGGELSGEISTLGNAPIATAPAATVSAVAAANAAPVAPPTAAAPPAPTAAPAAPAPTPAVPAAAAAAASSSNTLHVPRGLQQAVAPATNEPSKPAVATTAAATREPSPSRPPKQGKANTTGVNNTV